MQINDKNLKVVELQARLRSLSIYTGFIDGHYGGELDNAILYFQRTHNLTVDGIVGPKTLAKLDELTANRMLFLFIHCTATPEGKNITAQRIVDYHTKTKGWSRPGYSDIIELDGRIVNTYPWNNDNSIDPWEFTWGTRKLNKCSRHFSYIGGVNADDTSKAKDTRTREQLRAMETYINFHLFRHPDIIIVGHNQVQRKACPSFDVPEYLRSILVPHRNRANWGKLYE